MLPFEMSDGYSDCVFKVFSSPFRIFHCYCLQFEVHPNWWESQQIKPSSSGNSNNNKYKITTRTKNNQKILIYFRFFFSSFSRFFICHSECRIERSNCDKFNISKIELALTYQRIWRIYWGKFSSSLYTD